MEGIGSRPGRASSRYGSAPVFTRPVRRWQKQWIHVSSSPSSSVSYNHSNGGSNNNDGVSAVRLRRWTPVQPADSEAMTEERPKRKLRYTPIVVLEDKRKEADVEVSTSKTDQSFAHETLKNEDDGKRSSSAETEASDKSEATTKDLDNSTMNLEKQL